MSASIVSLRRQIDSAGDLQSVVRTMKAMAASNIGQYEQAVRALADYYRTVELGLGACLRASGPLESQPEADARPGSPVTIGAVVFGSDQGLVGQFNDVIADFALKTLAALPGNHRIWSVGERVYERLADAGLPLAGSFTVPNTVKTIAPLVGQIQIEWEALQVESSTACFYVFHNRPQSGALYQPVVQRLLPLDQQWRLNLTRVRWPTKIPPEVMGIGNVALRALIREYLYISLFRACAESLASENASRLGAMGRADKNIGELLEQLNSTFSRQRQASIDEELFDVVSGYESMGEKPLPEQAQ